MEGYLIRKAEVESMEGLAKTHFLNPNAQRINKSLGDATGLSGLGVHLVEIAPGHESTEMHRHHHEDECVFVLEGTGTAFIGDERFPIDAGDFIGYRAGGEAHRLLNDGEMPLRCLVIGQRLDHDVGDYPDLGKRIYRNRGLPWDLVDAERIEHPQAGKKV